MLHINTVNRQLSTINHLAVLASDGQRSELIRSPVFQQHQLLFTNNLKELVNVKADAYMDLMFEEDLQQEPGQESKKITVPDTNKPIRADAGVEQATDSKKACKQNMERLIQINSKRIEILSHLLPSPVFINSVIQPLSGIHPGFIRINGWPGFLDTTLIEASAGADSIEKAKKIFGDQILFVKDVPGFVNPRIISMIINEAWYTLGDGTSSKEEIDIAMKLGTGYPLGPFEWLEKVGKSRVLALLTALGKVDPLYGIAPGFVDG